MTREQLTYSELLKSVAQEFGVLGFETPQIDARLLLQEVTGFSHARLISSGGDAPEAEAEKHFLQLVERRKTGEPVHRILGRREFYGREFELSPDTLIPRPDTEILIEAVLENFGNADVSILDIGTGSGAIAVTLAAELPLSNVIATDISQEVLATAAANAIKHGVERRLSVVWSDLFAKVDGKFNLIVSNPPYIPTKDMFGLSPEVKGHDPHVALDGGDDGLDFYRHIIAAAARYLVPSGMLVFEIGIDQSDDVSALGVADGFALKEVRKDLAGIERVLVFEMQSVA